MTITDLTFSGPTHDVTVANSQFTGQAVIRADEMDNANVVLDGNSHPNISVAGCGDCYEGRIQIIRRVASVGRDDRELGDRPGR